MRWIQMFAAVLDAKILHVSAALAQGPPPPPPFGPPPGAFAGPGLMGPPLVPDPRALEQLDLSDAQRDRIEAALDDERRTAIRTGADLRIAMLDLEQQVGQDSPDRDAIASVTGRIADLQARLLQARVTAALAVRRALTPEQRAKLQHLRPQHGRPKWESDGPGSAPERER